MATYFLSELLKTILFLTSIDPLKCDILSLSTEKKIEKNLHLSCITPLMYTGPYVTRGSKAAFLQEQDTVLFHRASTNGTHCLVCALFSSGVGLPAVYTLSVTLWRNFPYVRCVISVRRQKKKKIERETERNGSLSPSE